MMKRNPSNVVESAKRKPFKRTIIKLLLMVITGILVLHFQINRPKVTDVYSTRDPFDSKRRGVRYTCGCNLPPSLQTPENSLSASALSSGSTLNRCYDRSELEDVKILMYSNITAKEVEYILNNTDSDQPPSRKTVTGTRVTNEAHSIFWTSKAVFEAFRNKLPELYLGGYRQSEMAVPYQQLLQETSLRAYPDFPRDFPTSYVGMSFVFTCNDCKNCSLDTVNQLFHNISGNQVNQTWGDCYYWGRMDQCKQNGDGFYQAKCQMYPTVGIPLIFAIQRFLGDFRNITGLNVTELTPPWDTTNPGYTSFDANVLYMNFSRKQPGDLELRFSEVEKGSSAWLQLVNLFPALDTECSELHNATACTGTSLCNVFQGDVETKGLILKCQDMENKAQCLWYTNDTTVDQHVYIDESTNLWSEFNITLHGKTAKTQDFLNLMCMDYICEYQPPYLVHRETESTMRKNSLNQFLEKKIFADSWAQASGVCTKTYKTIFRNSTSDGQTSFLETDCSQNSSTPEGNGFCWLTGRYRQLTDIPNSEEWHQWHQLNSSWNSTPEDIFWCYNVTEQQFVYWFIITFGVLFGWLGTVDLVFKWVMVLLAGLLQAFNKYGHVDENNIES